jgi:hypothetical protein
VIAARPTGVRRRAQAQVASLLAEIDERRRRLYVLEAHGATRAGLRELKEELRALREALAERVAGDQRPAAGGPRTLQQTAAWRVRRPRQERSSAPGAPSSASQGVR